MNAPSCQALAHPYSFTASVKATASLAPYLQSSRFPSPAVRSALQVIPQRRRGVNLSDEDTKSCRLPVRRLSSSCPDRLTVGPAGPGRVGPHHMRTVSLRRAQMKADVK